MFALKKKMENKSEPEMANMDAQPDVPRNVERKASFAEEGHAYDVRILIDTLTGLVERGFWSVEMTKPEHFLPSSTEKAVYLSVHGRERRGKTFLLSQISEEPFPSMDKSQRVPTEGISLRLIIANKDDCNLTKCPSLLLFDTAGSNAPFELANKLDRLATDCFMRELVHKVSHINVVVVGYLDLDDQRYLDELATKLTYRKYHQFGEVVVVHNFHDLKTVKEVEEQIKRDIIGAFAAQPEREGTWYKSQHFSHYVLAEHGSEAGKKYNIKSIVSLRSKAWNLASEEVHKVFHKIEEVANQLLPVYLMAEQQGAQTRSAKITINAAIAEQTNEEQKLTQPYTCDYTARELRMHGTVRLKFEPAADRGEESAMKLITDKQVKLSTFLQPGRVSASFLESSVFEPKIDVTITDEQVDVTLDAPACQVQQEVRGAVLTLTGNRTIANSNTLAERPSGDFTIIITFPSNWNLSSQQELIDNGVYHLTISRTARGLANSLPRVTRVPVGEGDFLEVTETKDETKGLVLPGRDVKFSLTSLVTKNAPNDFVVYPNTPQPEEPPPQPEEPPQLEEPPQPEPPQPEPQPEPPQLERQLQPRGSLLKTLRAILPYLLVLVSLFVSFRRG